MYRINIQHATDKGFIPKNIFIRRWAKYILQRKIDSAEITIRIVGNKEMSELNSTYRHKKGSTNVLAFPFVTMEDVKIKIPILGDIVICAEVIEREANEQDKSLESHWAHMIVHGILHLLGYDHQSDEEAQKMESLEIEIMNKMGFDNPYGFGENIQDYD